MAIERGRTGLPDWRSTATPSCERVVATNVLSCAVKINCGGKSAAFLDPLLCSDALIVTVSSNMCSLLNIKAPLCIDMVLDMVSDILLLASPLCACPLAPCDREALPFVVSSGCDHPAGFPDFFFLRKLLPATCFRGDSMQLETSFGEIYSLPAA